MRRVLLTAALVLAVLGAIGLGAALRAGRSSPPERSDPSLTEILRKVFVEPTPGDGESRQP